MKVWPTSSLLPLMPWLNPIHRTFVLIVLLSQSCGTVVLILLLSWKSEEQVFLRVSPLIFSPLHGVILFHLIIFITISSSIGKKAHSSVWAMDLWCLFPVLWLQADVLLALHWMSRGSLWQSCPKFVKWKFLLTCFFFFFFKLWNQNLFSWWPAMVLS